MKGDNARALELWEQTRESSKRFGRSPFPKVLADLWSAHREGTITQAQTAALVIKGLSATADLHNLSALNDLGTLGAAGAHNLVLNEDIFADLHDPEEMLFTEFDSSRNGSSKRPLARNLLSSQALTEAESLRVFSVRHGKEQKHHFIGRAMELATFADILKNGLCDDDGDDEDGRQVEPPLVVIGASGLGKTMLLDEFARRAPTLSDAVVVLKGGGRAGERHTSFFCFRSVFEQLLRVPQSGSIDE